MSEQKIIDIKVNYNDAITAVVALKTQINSLSDSNKLLNKDYASNSAEIETNKVQIKALTGLYNQQSTVLKDEITNIKGTEGAYQKLNLQYQVAQGKAKDMAAAHGVNSFQAINATKSAANLDTQLKAIDKTVGQNQRNVGNYSSMLSGLPGVFGQLADGGQAVFVKLRTGFESMQGATALYSESLVAKKEAQTAAIIADEAAIVAETELAAAQVAEMAAKNASTISTRAATTAKAEFEVLVAAGIATTADAIIVDNAASLAKSELSVAESTGAATAGAAATAEIARATATTAATVATEASSVAMKIFRIALISTGVGALVVALGSLIAYFSQTNEGSKQFARISAALSAVMQSGVKILGSYGKLLFSVATMDLNGIKEAWSQLTDNIKNATGEIGKNYQAGLTNESNNQMMAKRERTWSNERLVLLKEFEDAKIMASKRSSLDDKGKEEAAKKALQINENIYQNDLKIAKNKAFIIGKEQALSSKKDYQAITDSQNKVQQIINDHSREQLTVGNLLGKTEQRIAAGNKAAVTSAKTASDKRIAIAEKEASDEIKILEKKLQIELRTIGDKLQLDNLIQDEQLAGKIKTDSEWLNLDNARVIKERNSKLSQLSSEKDEALDVLIILEKEKKRIQSEGLTEENIRKIETVTNNINLELAKITEGEGKKKIILQESKTNIYKNNALADEKIRKDDLAIEALVLDNEFELAKGNIDRELQLTYDKIEAQRVAEITAANGNAEAIAAINTKYHLQDVTASDEASKKKIDNVFKYADAAANILTASSNFAKALGDNELANWAKNNKGKANYDVEYAKKKAKLDHDAAVRTKELSIMTTIMQTAQSIMSALAIPLGAGVPLAILNGVAGALQLATIIATPIPDEGSASSSSNTTTSTVTSKYHSGGEVGKQPDDNLKSNEITATLLKGEQILNIQQKGIFDNILQNVSSLGGSASVTSGVGVNTSNQIDAMRIAFSQALKDMPNPQIGWTEFTLQAQRQQQLERNKILQ